MTRTPDEIAWLVKKGALTYVTALEALAKFHGRPPKTRPLWCTANAWRHYWSLEISHEGSSYGERPAGCPVDIWDDFVRVWSKKQSKSGEYANQESFDWSNND